MNILGKLSLSRRLGAGFGLVLGLVLLITAIALWRMQQMNANTRYIVEISNHRIATAQEMANAANDGAVALYGFTLVTDDVDAKAQSALFNGAMTRYAAARKAYDEQIGKVQAGLPVAKLLDELDSAATPARLMGVNAMRTAESGGNLVAALNSMDPRTVMGEWRKQIGSLVDYETQAGVQAYAASQSAFQVARVGLIVATIVAFVVGVGAAIVILRGVTRPLAEAIGHARRIATGDLTAHIEMQRSDEVGSMLTALAQMQERLRALVGSIRSSTDGIATASSEIASGNHDLSVRTEQAASNLQQTASSMEQLTGTVHQSADSARTASQMANAAADVAQRGGSVVSQVIATMDEISSSSKKIADIIGVIDGIAFQTNILALNAAVEAARAGEQGRGFAVVASEVRSLAQRSAQAAKEIKSLISNSVDRVEAGTRLVGNAGATMQEIVDSVHRVSSIVGEITAAAAEQGSGIGQVNNAVAQLDHMTQQNAALVEQSAAAAESLKEQALRLASVVSVFRVEAGETVA